jgi:hypothetical protein
MMKFEYGRTKIKSVINLPTTCPNNLTSNQSNIIKKFTVKSLKKLMTLWNIDFLSKDNKTNLLSKFFSNFDSNQYEQKIVTKTEICQVKTFRDLYRLLRTLTFKQFMEKRWLGNREKQELLFTLFCHLGLINEHFGNYIVQTGNFDRQTLTSISLPDFMNTSITRGGDKSDLTFRHRENFKSIIATTSKNISSPYQIDDLDINSIIASGMRYINSGYDIKLCVVVPDAKEFHGVVSRMQSNNNYLNNMCQNSIVIDQKDLEKYYQNFLESWPNKVPETARSPLVPRFHQELCSVKIHTLFEKLDYYDVILGAIPRSGKTYIAARLMEMYINSCSENLNFLILTTCPNETIAQYISIFSSYTTFANFSIHVAKATQPSGFDAKGNNIIICSHQLLKIEGNESVRDIPWIKLDYKLRCIDEAHNGGTTELSKQILYNYGYDAKTLFITATYNKPVAKFNIPPEAQVLWNILDVKLAKNMNCEEMKLELMERHTKFGQVLDQKHFNIIHSRFSDAYKYYQTLPQLELLTFQFHDEIKQKVLEQTKNSDRGFSMQSVFLLMNSAKRILEKFQNPEKVKVMLNQIFSNNNSILQRMEDIARNAEYNSRWFSNENPLTILVFLPCGSSLQPVNMVSNTLKKFMIDNKIASDFEIGIINSQQSRPAIEIIEETRNIAINNSKKGVIIFSGRQCSMGVSLHHCDIVIMMNNGKVGDQYYQMAYRSMTEAVGKTVGFVVDMNIQRACEAVVEMASDTYKNLGLSEAIRKVLTQRLIPLNSDEWMSDYFGLTPNNIDSMTRYIFDIYNNSPSGNIENILKRLKYKCDLFASGNQKLLKSLFKIPSTQKCKKVIKELKVGIESVDAKEKKKEKKEIHEEKIKVYEDIMYYVIPLISLLTIHNPECGLTFDVILIEIHNNPRLNTIFIERVCSWWGQTLKKNAISIFIKMYKKYCKDKNEFNHTVKRIKEIFHINLGNRKQLSEMIDTYLIPHINEKKQNAEVSTPYKLRNEMLDRFPVEFWTYPKKVFEPCSGKGGFIIDIINRFMDGLSEYIQDENERYKLILEQCLYFADINSQNIFICNLLINPHDEYTTNYYHGNTLELDIKQEWKIDKFDAVIGNPPYQNQSGNKGKGNTLWDKFVIKSLNNWLSVTGYLSFVHPQGWRQLDNKTGKLMISKQILYLNMNSVDVGQSIFGCSTTFDYYLLQNKIPAHVTVINDYHGVEYSYDLKDVRFIPNHSILLVNEYLDYKNEHGIIYNRTNYGADKKWMSKVNNNEFKYPCIYSINKKNELSLRYSNTNMKGHFGITKYIVSNGSGFLMDSKGEYGCTQWAYYVQCNTTDMDDIHACFESSKFKLIIDAVKLTSNKYNYVILKYLKKNFWKDFIN